MQNFRQFEAGPDPFGRKFQVWFKWLQTAISIRGADTVDVKFVLENEQAGSAQKTIALPHADLVALSRETGRQMDDAWCSRLAALHLVRLVETGEDMDKDIVTVTPAALQQYAQELARQEAHAA
ncbi:MAG: hypothetical protein ABSH00_13485 [Bryobacteraceae bacterium]|jgi:hypothetical protein